MIPDYLVAILLFFVVLPIIGLTIFTIVMVCKHSGPKNRKPKTYYNSSLPTKLIPNTEIKQGKQSVKKDLNDCKKVLSLISRILTEIIVYHDNQKHIVQNNIGIRKKEIVSATLSKMDVSKINRNRSRIDIYALRHAHIHTLYDLDRYPRPLTSIYGVGERSRNSIVRNLNEIKRELSADAIIRLSYDNRTNITNQLVLSLAIFLETEQYNAEARRLLSVVAQINTLIKKLKKLLSAFNKDRDLAITVKESKKIYEETMALYNSNFLNLNEKLIAPFNKTKKKTIAEAWNNFKNNPIAFNKIIELFSSNSYGSDKEYGLSDELAKKIKNTPLNLDGLKLSLRTYQEWGTKFIISQRRTILGDEMGLGKTVQAIAAMISLKNTSKTHFCVVCPLSVLTNWCREIEKFSSLNCYKIYGYYRDYYFKQWIKSGGVVVTTYETIDSLSFQEAPKIDYLVVDEAHFVKNPWTKRSENISRLLLKSDYVTYLTGTVLENKVEEMVTLISQIRPIESRIIQQYARPQTKQIFKEKISGIYFRRRRKDVLSELPEKTEINEWCDLNDAEIDIYEQNILSKSFAEARRVSWNAGHEASTKMKRLKEIVELAKEEDRKVLIFSFFLKTIFDIKQEFGNTAYGPIHGGISSAERQSIIDNFSNAKAGSVLICQIQSGGIGLNIQSASVVVICEPQLKSSTENQAISRAYRMGQSRDVFVHRLLASDTIDERLEEMLNRKQNEFDNFADSSLTAEESFKIDTEMFTNIMDKEYKRIESKYKNIDDIKPIIASKNKAETPSTIKNIPNSLNVIEKRPNIKGCSVTSRISTITQPRGGLLNIRFFDRILLNPSVFIEGENVHASLIGLSVDYLTRLMNGALAQKAFEISLLGARNVGETNKASSLLNKVKGLDDESIKCAIKLTGYDVAFRSNPAAYVPVEAIEPDTYTINNVREMVKRSLSFLKRYGPVIKDGFTFEGGYTSTISSGDGDYMTNDTIWDFKVYKKEPTSNNTLQLLIYYVMGLHSIHPEFKNIKYVGIFNPRTNIAYRYELSKLSKNIISIIEDIIIKY